jgi:ABC-type Fe3+-hydroxamate transport system substrate-binding protein
VNDDPRAVSAVSAVSLVPSITETLLSWGVTPVAVTRFCEAPGVTTVGGTKNPDVAAIVALAPDVVLMDEEENRVEDAEALRSSGVKVHATSVRSVAGAAAAMGGLAAALGVEAPGEATTPRRAPPALSVWVPIWRRPWMTINGDTYGSDLLAHAGMVNVFASHEARYPTTTAEEAAARGPDVVLAPSEPYRFSERHRGELEEVARVEFVDGRDLFWWGTRTAGALDRMASLAVRLTRR